MNHADHILNELQELSPTLAAFPKQNPFSVPEGYFESLPALLLLQTADNPVVNAASVPQGYFEGLADVIMNRIKSEANMELEESSVLAGIGKTNVFTVPEGYFEQLPASVMSMVKDSSVVEETSFISPLVAGIGNKNVFTVPAGYFENFSVKRAAEPSGARVVKMAPRTNIWKYAAAAVVTGVMAISGYFIFNNKQTPALTAEVAKVVEKGEVIVKTNSFDKEMSTVSDADIVSYLESTGQDVDAALVASLTDDVKSLPDATDYIIDDKTLDNMLNELELN